MSLSEIFELVGIVLTFISSLAAAISCIRLVRNSRPQITIIFTGDAARGFLVGDEFHYAFLTFQAVNLSQQAGEIRDISILYDNVEYHAEMMSMNYDITPKPLEVFSENVPIDLEKFRLKCPIVVAGFLSVFGTVIFPTFPKLTTNVFSATVIFRFAHRKKIFRGVVFYSAR